MILKCFRDFRTHFESKSELTNDDSQNRRRLRRRRLEEESNARNRGEQTESLFARARIAVVSRMKLYLVKIFSFFFFVT